MNEFSVKSYWDHRYARGGDSGWGSKNTHSVNFKAGYINNVIEKYNINTICEMGCGDGNQLKHFSGYTTYYGYDIAPSVVRKCKSLYNKDESKVFYYDIEDVLKRRYDLALSLDVIYHLVEDDLYHKYMRNLFLLSDVVCVFSTDNDSLCKEICVKNRKFTKDIGDDFKLVDTLTYNGNVGFYLYVKEK